MTDTAAELVVDVTARESVTAVLTRLEAQLGQTNSVAERLASSLESRLGASQAKAGRDTLSHAQAMARLQATSGDTAGAIRTLQSALEGVDRSSTAAIRTETQLVNLQTKLGKELSGTSQFADAFKQGLFGFVAPAAAATLALDTLRATAQSFVDAFNFKGQLDATTASIKSQLDGFRDAGATYDEAIAFGRRYNITQQETNNILASSTDILRTSSASVGELESALIRLQSRDVSKPISEASRALRELQAGDTTSIKELFNVPARDANRMKAEILAGGDAVKVLTAYLDGAKVGMAALEQRTQGAAGKMQELALAQEDLKLAQAEFAQGPGLKLLEAQIRVTSGATRVLSGDFATAGQSIANAAAEGSFGFRLFDTIMGGNLTKLAQYQAAQTTAAAATQQSSTATAQHAITIQQSADAEDRRTASLQGSIIAQQEAAAATINDTAAKQAAAAQAQLLEAQIRSVAESYLALNPNIDAAGVASAVASGKIDAAVGTYINMTLATQRAKNALAALQAQAGVAGGGVTEGRAERDRPGDLAQARAAGLEAARVRADEAAAAEARYQQALGNNGPAIARANAELAALRKGTGAYYDKLAEIERLKKQGGGAGGGGGRTKLTDQQKLNNQLQADEDKANDRYAQAELDHAKKLLSIQADYAKKRLAAEDSLQQSLLEGGASFYDSLINMENQGAARAADAQYQAFLANELPTIAAEKGADVAEAYQDAYEKVLLDRAKRQAEIEKAQQEGDSGRAAALAGVDAKYRAAEDAKLAKIKEGNDSIAAERDRALAEEGARYDEANGKIGESADRAAERKIAASVRAGQAIDAEQAQLDRLASTYDRIAPARGTSGTTAAQPAATGTATPTAEAAPVPAGGELLGALDAIRAAVDSAAEKITRAEGETARAVRSSAQRGGVAG
jgi:hypothetical protein